MKRRCRTFHIMSLLSLLVLIAAPNLPAAQSTRDILTLPINDEAGFKVQVWSNKTSVQPGGSITIYFKSTQDCYLVLVDKGTSGKETVIFPNAFSGPLNFIHAGKTYQFPPPNGSFQFRVSGPTGTERVMAYATLKPNDAANRLGLRQSIGAGQFKSMVAGSFRDVVVQSANQQPSNGWTTADTTFQVGQGTSGSGEGSSTIISSPGQKANTYYVLAIGADTAGLVGAKPDAEDFARTMRQKLNIPGNQVRILSGPNADINGIRNGFSWLRQRLDQNDTALIYFSGHGSYILDYNGDEADGYDEVFIPYGFEENNISTVIIDDEFGDWLNKLPTSKIIVVVDSCHSGTITKNPGFLGKGKFFQGGQLGVARSLDIVTRGTAKDSGSNVTLLAAAREDQTAIERNGRGVFTQNLCNAIRSQSRNLYDGFRSARAQVLTDTQNQQEPVIFGPNELLRQLTW